VLAAERYERQFGITGHYTSRCSTEPVNDVYRPNKPTVSNIYSADVIDTGELL
jgi:hypothetical protein